MQLSPHESFSISALPDVSYCGHTDEQVVVVMMPAPGPTEDVTATVVRVGVGVVVVVLVAQVIAAVAGFAATPTGQETAPESCAPISTRRKA
jgi:hypothetical protein